MLNERQIWKKLLISDRGIVMMEFALLLPIFLTLIVGVVEVPRVFIAKNRAINMTRVVADIGSRNQDFVPAIAQKHIIEHFTNNGRFGGSKVLFMPALSESKDFSATEWLNDIASGKVVSTVAQIATLGEYSRLVTGVFNLDRAYRHYTIWKFNTILPVDFMRAKMGAPKSNDYWNIVTPDCYMPNRNCYVHVMPKEQSYEDKLLDSLK